VSALSAASTTSSNVSNHEYELRKKQQAEKMTKKVNEKPQGKKKQVAKKKKT